VRVVWRRWHLISLISVQFFKSITQNIMNIKAASQYCTAKSSGCALVNLSVNRRLYKNWLRSAMTGSEKLLYSSGWYFGSTIWHSHKCLEMDAAKNN
jgi:hypothetical protein